MQTGGQLEIEIRPFYLVPDTNGFIDHLEGLRKVLASGTYILVVPLIGMAISIFFLVGTFPIKVFIIYFLTFLLSLTQ